MVTNYQRGVRFEYQVRDDLAAAYPFVMRAAGSRGLVDIVAIGMAIGKHDVVLVQCKTKKKKVDNEKIKKLSELAEKIGAEAFLAYKGEAGIVYEKLGGGK